MFIIDSTKQKKSLFIQETIDLQDLDPLFIFLLLFYNNMGAICSRLRHTLVRISRIYWDTLDQLPVAGSSFITCSSSWFVLFRILW